MSDVKITISKINDDNFVGAVFAFNEMRSIFATNYIQAVEEAKLQLENILKTVANENTEVKK